MIRCGWGYYCSEQLYLKETCLVILLLIHRLRIFHCSLVCDYIRLFCHISPCNWTVDDPIFALLHLFFCDFLYLFCIKLFSLSEIMFTNDEHVFLRISVTNLLVLCFDIYAIPTICTPYYQSRLNLVSEICLVNILTFSAWGVTVIF